MHVYIYIYICIHTWFHGENHHQPLQKGTLCSDPFGSGVAQTKQRQRPMGAPGNRPRTSFNFAPKPGLRSLRPSIGVHAGPWQRGKCPESS